MPNESTARGIAGGINADQLFWDYLAAGEFRMCRCGGCGVWQWPAHFRCGECGSWEHEWPQVEPAGTVYSWTRTYMPFPRTGARADQVPFVTALVEIDGTDGKRVFGVVDGPSDRIRVGERVEGTIQPASERSCGYPSITWRITEEGGR